MRRLLLLSSMVLAGCATQANTDVGLDQVPPGSTCERSAALDTFKGQPATAEVGQQIRAASRAQILRWVPHGRVVTMEYNDRRVTVWLRPDSRIDRVNCG